MATTFWLLMGYKFGYMVVGDTRFDSKGVFSGHANDEEIAEIEGLRDVATATDFGTTLAVNGF